MTTHQATRLYTQETLNLSKEQLLVLRMVSDIPNSLDAPPLVPALQPACIKLAAILPPLPGLPHTCIPTEGSPYVPPRWYYGYVYSPALALQACMARAPVDKTPPPREYFAKICDDSINIDAERAYLAVDWLLGRVSEILEHQHVISFEHGWENGHRADVLVFGDSWDLRDAPTDDQITEISNLLFGELQEPRWFLDRHNCLWRAARS